MRTMDNTGEHMSYCALFPNSGKGFAFWSEQSHFLQLLVLKYVMNKDVFMRYHKAHLTRRLILDTSADNEKEENMVEWLRVSVLDGTAGSLIIEHPPSV